MRLLPLTLAAGLVAAIVITIGRPAAGPAAAATPTVAETVRIAETWRAAHRTIDLHQHIDGKPDNFARAVRIMDRSGIGIGVNLSGGTVTSKPDGKSEFERVKALADANHPDRFVHYMNLDYAGWDDPDFSDRAVQQIVAGRKMGAAGLKEYKRLGLFLRDRNRQLIKIDDPKLDPVWAKCGELQMPVSIHVADPRAFWLPFDAANERWKELKDHKTWWFGDREKFPAREELLAALDRVIARHRGTTFVCVHFANNAEDLQWVDQALERNPNMLADVAARIPEIGRHDPEKVRTFFRKHRDRILFATDFMVYDRLILGSGGDAERPTDDDGCAFYAKCWRWFETSDRNWPHMTPIQGDWTIDSIALDPDILRRVYFDNARRLLARSLPPPTLTVRFIRQDFQPNGRGDTSVWNQAAPASLEYQSHDASVRPALSTTLRALWSDQFLYLLYECPFTELTTFEPVAQKERLGLWDRDVVEAFLAPDPAQPNHYAEIEWAPTGEKLDVMVRLPEKDFAWTCPVEFSASVDATAKIWRLEARIPFSSFGDARPAAGQSWRANFYRHDAASKSGLAFNPTLTPSFHTPARFGWLKFADSAPAR